MIKQRNCCQYFFGFMALLLLLTVNGCGYQLRGEFHFPDEMSSLYIVTNDPYGELIKALRYRLQASGINVVDDKEQASAILVIEKDQMKKTILSVGSRAEIREFQLHYHVQFVVVSADGDEISSTRSLELERDYSFAEQQILGKSGEEELLRKNLYQDMAASMLMILSL